jgi:hypothetical protein
VSSTTYRCLNCLERAVTRGFDVSHLSRTCDICGTFGRFVHQGVYDQYREFEASPPEEIAWTELDRMRKFVVAEGLVRSGKTLADFEVTVEPSG